MCTNAVDGHNASGRQLYPMWHCIGSEVLLKIDSDAWLVVDSDADILVRDSSDLDRVR